MTLPIEKLMHRAVTAHREGKLEEAERLYGLVLDSESGHPHANHNLGLIAVSRNNKAGALPFFEAALLAKPEVEQFWVA